MILCVYASVWASRTGTRRNIPVVTSSNALDCVPDVSSVSAARSTLKPIRVTELSRENNGLGGFVAASGNNSKHGHSSSQPTMLNARHQEQRGISNSQPAGSTTECLSPLKTRSQGRTNFRKL